MYLQPKVESVWSLVHLWRSEWEKRRRWRRKGKISLSLSFHPQPDRHFLPPPATQPPFLRPSLSSPSFLLPCCCFHHRTNEPPFLPSFLSFLSYSSFPPAFRSCHLASEQWTRRRRPSIPSQPAKETAGGKGQIAFCWVVVVCWIHSSVGRTEDLLSRCRSAAGGWERRRRRRSGAACSRREMSRLQGVVGRGAEIHTIPNFIPLYIHIGTRIGKNKKKRSYCWMLPNPYCKVKKFVDCVLRSRLLVPLSIYGLLRSLVQHFFSVSRSLGISETSPY